MKIRKETFSTCQTKIMRCESLFSWFDCRSKFDYDIPLLMKMFRKLSLKNWVNCLRNDSLRRVAYVNLQVLINCMLWKWSFKHILEVIDNSRKKTSRSNTKKKRIVCLLACKYLRNGMNKKRLVRAPHRLRDGLFHASSQFMSGSQVMHKCKHWTRERKKSTWLWSFVHLLLIANWLVEVCKYWAWVTVECLCIMQLCKWMRLISISQSFFFSLSSARRIPRVWKKKRKPILPRFNEEHFPTCYVSIKSTFPFMKYAS